MKLSEYTETLIEQSLIELANDLIAVLGDVEIIFPEQEEESV